MISERHAYLLTDIIELIGGGTPKSNIPEYWNGDIPWLSVKDFNNDDRYVYSTEKSITQAGLDNSSTKMLAPNDIIISARGTVGELAMIPSPMAFNQSCYGIRGRKDIISQPYLYYFLKDSIRLLKSQTHGSVFDTITRDTFANIEINLPPIDAQKAIAAVLSALDDKIELNNRINRNLKAQAQAIFKSWFVDFEPFRDGEFVDSELGPIPKGWEIASFLKNIKLLGGGTPKTGIDDFWNGSIPFFTPKDITSKYYVLDTEKHLTDLGLRSCNSKLYPENTVFITARGTVGKVAIAGFPMAMNQSCYAIMSDVYEPQFVHQLVMHTVEKLKGKASGAVFDALVTRDFEAENVVYPPVLISLKYSNMVKPLYSEMLKNAKQSRTLAALRDTLLPKLMSGEIRVPLEV